MMCINWKVVGALAVAGLGVLAFAPNLIAAALPILVLAACPLSMVVMMRAMSGGRRSEAEKARSEDGTTTEARQGELAELQAKIDQLRAERGEQDNVPTPARVGVDSP